MRQPLTKVERRARRRSFTTYSLAQHRTVAELCRKGLQNAGIDVDKLRYEVGLSELGEWMNLRIYLPSKYNIKEKNRNTETALRLECFNSVDGSSRLVIIFGWLRFVCSNGLVIGETKIEIKERHGQSLDLVEIASRIPASSGRCGRRQIKMQSGKARKSPSTPSRFGPIEILLKDGGRRLPRRVYHICQAGKTSSSKTPLLLAPRQKSRSGNSVLCRALRSGRRQSMTWLQAMSYVATKGTTPRSVSHGSRRFPPPDSLPTAS